MEIIKNENITAKSINKNTYDLINDYNFVTIQHELLISVQMFFFVLFMLVTLKEESNDISTNGKLLETICHEWWIWMEIKLNSLFLWAFASKTHTVLVWLD